jgi:hypothetical protein
LGGSREYLKVVEREGDVFVVMKAQYTHSAASANNNATNAAKTNTVTVPLNVNAHAYSNNHISTAMTAKNNQNIIPQQPS